MNEHTSSRILIKDIHEVGKVKTELARAFEALNQRNFRLVFEIAKGLLRVNGRLPQAHYLVGRVAIETRQFDIALKSLETAVDLDGSKSEYWAFLAIVYSQYGKIVKAENAVVKAQNIGSDEAYVLHSIANVLSVLGHVEDAIKNLHMAVQNSPNDGIYHYALGVSLLEVGDFNGAQQSLKKAVALNENDAKSWWLLSSLVNAQTNDMANQLVSIMKKTEEFSRPNPYLGYAAGKLFEDTQCWDEAFDAYKSGADAKRQFVNYDSSEAKKTFEVIKTICTKDWVKFSVNELNDAAPIFIIGQPRTGTTLVDRIISSHSLVHSAGEPVQLAMSLRAITGVRTEEFISAELINKSINVTGTELAEKYISRLAKLRGTTPYFIDKFPMNFMLVGFIVKAFPRAKIIHVTRSPADTCFAVFKQLFGDLYQHSYDQSEMAEHYVMYYQLMEHWHNTFPGKIFDISYENIIADSQGQARTLIQYLGLEWEDACASFEKNKTAVVTASATQVREKVHNRSIGRWKNYQKQLSPTLDILNAAGISP